MSLLFSYLRRYWPLISLALVLATINQVFSLLDPLIFRHVIDDYATRFAELHDPRILPRRHHAARGRGGRGVRLARGQELPGLLHQPDHTASGRRALLRRHPPFARAAVLGVRGSAQRRNTRQAAEGAVGRRAPDLGVDQRPVHVARRHHLRDGLRLHGALAHRAGVPADRAGAGHHQLGAEQADQDDSETDRRGDDRAGGLDDRIASQHRAGQKPRAGTAGDRTAEQHHREDPEAGTEEGEVSAEPELHSGHRGEFSPDEHPLPDALPHLYPRYHGGSVLLAVDLLVLHLRTAAGARQHHQHLPRDRGIAECLREHPADPERAETCQPSPAGRCAHA